MFDNTTEFFNEQENIAEPTFFMEAEIGNFIRDYACVCGSHLLSKHADSRLYNAWCPACDALMTVFSFTRVENAEAAKQNELIGLRELRPDIKPRDEKQISSELGF